MPVIKLPKAAAPLAAMAVAQMILAQDAGPWLADVKEISGVDLPHDPAKPTWQVDLTLVDEIRKREADVPRLLATCFALWAEDLISEAEYGHDDEAAALNALTYLQWVESTGYALSDVDVELRDSFTKPDEDAAA